MAKTDIEILISSKNSANQELIKLSKELSNVAKALKDVAGPADEAAKGTKKAGDAADDAGKKADSASTKFAKLGIEMAKGAAMGVGFAAVNGVMRGIGDAFDFVVDAGINMNAQLEQTKIAFTTMLGSAEAADQFLQDMADFAAQTPFDFPELITASQRMMAYGFAAEDVLPLLEDIGNASAALGAGTEGVNRMTMALGQMAAKGRVQTQELLQLTELGIPAFQILADGMDTTVAKAQEMVTAGKVGSDAFLEMFQTWSQANFGDMMSQQANTFSGAMANINDVLTMASAEGLKPFYDLLRDGAIEVAGFLESADFESFVKSTVSAMETAGQGIRDFVTVAGPGFIEVAKAGRDFLVLINEFDQRMAAISGDDGQMSLFQMWIHGVRKEMDLLAAALVSGTGYVMLYGGALQKVNIEFQKMILLAKAAKDLDFGGAVDVVRDAEEQQRAANEYMKQGSQMVVDGWVSAYDTMSTSAELHTRETTGFFEELSRNIVASAQGAASGYSSAMDEIGEYGPFFEEVFIGPLLKMTPQVREHMKDLFTLDPAMGSEWANQIAEAMRSGAVSLEEGLDLMAGLPEEVVTPALERVRQNIIRELGEKAWDGVIHEPLQRELDLIDRALAGTEPVLAQAGQGFVEFATTGEQALRELAGEILTFADIQSRLHDGVSTAAGAMSHWERQLSDVEKALAPLQEKMDAGITLSAEEAAMYDTLTWGAERYAGGIENDLMPAYQEAVTRSVEFTQRQDELNQMLADGTITQKEHKDMMLDAALAGDDASLAAFGLAEAQGDVATAIEGVIQKIRDLLVDLGLIPPEVDMSIDLSTTEADRQVAAFRQAMRDNPATIDLFVNQINQQGFTAYADGGISQGGMALVGEKGPELVVLPKGAEVIPNHQTMPFLGGFANGTGMDLTDADRITLKILGDLELALSKENIKNLEAELAGYWDARAVAEATGQGEAVIADIDEKIRAKQHELALIGQIAGTSIGQGILEEVAKAADIAFRQDVWEAAITQAEILFDRFGAAMSDGAAQQVQKMQEEIARMDASIAMATAAGLNEEALTIMQAMRDSVANDLALLESDMQAAIEQGFASAGVEEWTEAQINKLTSLIKHTPELVNQVLDDIVAGVNDGKLDIEQAYAMLGDIPQDQLIPALEKLEKAWTVDLTEAILSGSLEQQEALQALLKLLQDVEKETAKAGGSYPKLGISPGTVSGGGGGGPSLPSRGYANGGIITTPQVAMIGEGGTHEAVIPLDASHPSASRFVDQIIERMQGGGKPPVAVFVDSQPVAARVGESFMAGRRTRGI